MIEEQDDGPHELSQSELHSIAVFCQRTGCPLPKEVSSCLLRESTSAKLGSVIFCFAFVVSLYTIFGFGFWLGLMSLGVVDDVVLIPVAWLMRGMTFEFIVQIFVLFVSFGGALNGFTINLAAAFLAAVMICGIVGTAVWYVVTPNDEYGIRTEGIFIVGPICILIATVALYTGFAR